MRALVQDGDVVHRALPPDLEDDVVPVVQEMPSYLSVHVACDDGRQMRDAGLTAMDAELTAITQSSDLTKEDIKTYLALG